MPSAKHRAAIARVFAVCCFSFLTACGGGGSAVTGTTNPTGGPPTPPSQPSVPQAIYTGPRTQATLDAATAVTQVQSVFPALEFLTLNAQSIQQPLPAANYTDTLKGQAGGTDTVTGSIASDGSGWVEQQYDNYDDGSGDGVQNGGFIVFQTAHSGDVVSAGTLGFDHYRITFQGQTFEYDGSIAYNFSGRGAGEGAGISSKVVGNVSVSSGSFQAWMAGVTVDEDMDGNAVFSGQVYDSFAGAVSLSTPVPVTLGTGVMGYPQIFPQYTPAGEAVVKNATGDVLLTGTGGAALHVESLNVYYAFLGLDSAGNGTIDSGARFDYTTGELDATQPMGSNVAALAEVPSAATVGGAITVDAKYSYAPNGFVNYAWKLLSVPAGSALRATGSSAVLSFTPDISGTYLWQMTATSTAGSQSAFDLLPVDVSVGTGGLALESDVTKVKALDYIYAHVGETVTLDASASPEITSTQAGINGNIWALNAPAGSTATLASLNDVITTFVPDKPGFYYAILGSIGSDFLNYAPTTVIAVDEPYRFAPAVPVFADSADTISGLSTGSFGSEGDGIVFGDLTMPSLNHGDEQATWITAGSDGFFSSLHTASLGTPSGRLGAFDLNGDGVTDFAAPYTDCDMNFFASTLSGGTFSGGYSTQALTFASYPNCSGGNLAGLYRAGIVSGEPEVVALWDITGTDFFQGFQNFVANSSGVFQAPVLTAVQNMDSAKIQQVFDLRLVDVNGDGVPDLVATIGFGPGAFNDTTSVYLQIYTGNTDGTFTYLASYALTGSSNTLISSAPIVIDDFNGDSKLDIAVAYNDTLDLFYGDGSGAFTTTDTRSLYSGTFTASSQAEYLTEADVNGDGHPDLMVTGAPPDDPNGFSVIKLFLSGTGGVLGDDLEYPVTDLNYQTPTGLASGDFNQDGLQDLALSDEEVDSGNMAVFFMPQVQAVTSATTSSGPVPAAELPPRRKTTAAETPHRIAAGVWGRHVLTLSALRPH